MSGNERIYTSHHNRPAARVCCVLIAVVLLQSGKTAGLSGVIGGGSETYLSKNKAKTFDAKLARATKWFAIVFVVLDAGAEHFLVSFRNLPKKGCRCCGQPFKV
jgi:preprotein translocase subunit SecG